MTTSSRRRRYFTGDYVRRPSKCSVVLHDRCASPQNAHNNNIMCTAINVYIYNTNSLYIIYYIHRAVFPIQNIYARTYNMGDSASEFAFGERAEDAVVKKKNDMTGDKVENIHTTRTDDRGGRRHHRADRKSAIINSGISSAIYYCCCCCCSRRKFTGPFVHTNIVLYTEDFAYIIIILYIVFYTFSYYLLMLQCIAYNVILYF